MARWQPAVGQVAPPSPKIRTTAFAPAAIREFLDYVKKFDGVWWATREEIADWYLQNHKSHIG
jgi:hypothetical protein